MTRPVLLVALACLAFLHLAPAATAQVYAIELADAKEAKKLRKHLVSLNGREVLVGEPYSGMAFDSEKNQIIFSPRIELFVADPKDPTKVPYRFEDGKREPVSKRYVISLQRDQIKMATRHLPDQSLYGLATEYEQRVAALDELRDELDDAPKGSAAWFTGHRRLVSDLEKLRTWLASTTFPDAAEKLDKDIERERKVIEKEATEERARRGQDSAAIVETPEELVAVSQELTGGARKHHVAESEHVRITFDTEVLSDGTALDLLRLAERLIDGFRTEFVDPWRSDDYEDYIPDRIFKEYWFGPEDVKLHEQFFEEYYRQGWGQNKEERLKAKGTRTVLGTPQRSLDYWQLQENTDPAGIVAHGMGHTLATLHYGGGLVGMQQDWLEEAVAYYLSLEYLGRNNVTCLGQYQPKEGGYVKREEEKKQRGEKPLRMGLRDFFNAVALKDGRRIEVTAMKILYELDEADLSKAWSFYDWLAKEEGLRGQLFLRAAARYARNRSTFLNEWRKAANEIFEIEGQDVFKWIDDLWRQYAQHGQSTGAESR